MLVCQISLRHVFQALVLLALVRTAVLRKGRQPNNVRRMCQETQGVWFESRPTSVRGLLPKGLRQSQQCQQASQPSYAAQSREVVPSGRAAANLMPL